MIRASSLSPAEGERRVFVIEEAEELRDESQNALLKTLEEPAPFAHLILICSEPELLAETILSRCAPVEFGPLAPDAVLEALGRGCGGRRGRPAERRRRRARPHCCSASGERRCGRPPSPPPGPRARRTRRPSPGASCSTRPSEAGGRPGAEEERRLLEEAESAAKRGRKGKLTREATEQVKRAERRARTQALDLGLALCCAWYRDLAAVASGADDVVLNADRREQLAEDAEGLDPARRTGGGGVGARHPPAPARQRLRGARPRGALAPPRGRACTQRCEQAGNNLQTWPASARGGERGRRIPMRLWLGAAFAGVSLITAASVYVFVDDSSGRTLQSESADLAVGKTSSLADDLGKVDKLHGANVLAAGEHRELRGLGGQPARQSVRARPGSRRARRRPAGPEAEPGCARQPPLPGEPARRT